MLYWAFPQSPRGRYHVVVRDVVLPGERFPRQVTACGRRIVQAEEWTDGTSREYLREYACPRCLALHPVPDESVTWDGQPWPQWEAQAVASPMFPGAEHGPQVSA